MLKKINILFVLHCTVNMTIKTEESEDVHSEGDNPLATGMVSV